MAYASLRMVRSRNLEGREGNVLSLFIQAIIALIIFSATPGSAPALTRDDLVCPVRNDWREGSDECPCQQGWKPILVELRRILVAHHHWIEQEGWLDQTVHGQAILCNADLRGANLQRAYLFRAKLQGADLSGAKLQGAGLKGADLSAANLQEADLSDADLRGAGLKGADLSAANLQEADLSDADLRGAGLKGADLWGADLSSANLKGADLFSADLQYARLASTNIDDARLAFTNLTSATFGPIGVPQGYVVGIKGLSTILPVSTTLPESKVEVSALVHLRELLQQSGFRDDERELTFAIEHSKTQNDLSFGKNNFCAQSKAAYA